MFALFCAPCDVHPALAPSLPCSLAAVMGDFGLSLVKLAKFEDEEGTKVGKGAGHWSCCASMHASICHPQHSRKVLTHT